MKPGANKTEQYDIYKLWKEGHSTVDISRHMGIYPKTVQNFIDHFEKGNVMRPPTSAALRAKPGMPRHPGQANEMLSAELSLRDHEIGVLKDQIAQLTELVKASAIPAGAAAAKTAPPEAPKTTTVQVPGTAKK